MVNDPVMYEKNPRKSRDISWWHVVAMARMARIRRGLPSSGSFVAPGDPGTLEMLERLSFSHGKFDDFPLGMVAPPPQ